MVGPHSTAEARLRVKKVLEQCEKKKISTVSFPAIGTAVIQPPPTWTKMEGRDVEIILLTPDSDEYKKIEAAFLTSSEIQNKGQWQRYSVLKQEVDKKYPEQINEQFLYHGTTKEICQKINNNGFNRSFCGRNAVAHGHGTYFALEAWYSCQHKFSSPDENGLKYVYRARVVTGMYCRSRRGMKEPDPLDPNDPQAGLFDCAVDDLEDPFIFVVFCDAGAYPDYLIIFKNI
uniref:Poly [ADP-ribose] polymerase n=1 Tax=Pygocentrus nattereri TaxID=42514 RepID=A0AAR2ISV0_PYGNA